jgi:hypothetical protein
MKKGDRRKAAKRRNRAHLVRPKGIKGRHKNPAFPPLDQETMRKIANQAIGAFLIQSLDIDFIGNYIHDSLSGC